MITKVKKAKILFFDIETAPNLAHVWGKWEQNVIAFERHWYMLSFCAKWAGEKEVMRFSLPDYRLFKREKTNDRELVKDLWKLFDEADVVIAHNGDQFDIKKANTRFLQHGLLPPTPYKTIDTKKVAKKYFRFDSNKLDDLGDYLKIGRKIQTGGFELWLACMAGDKKAWKIMMDYNAQDVLLLEAVYMEMKHWMDNHPNMNLLTGEADCCPNCGGHRLERRGERLTRTSAFQRYQCKDCGAWSSGAKVPSELVLR